MTMTNTGFAPRRQISERAHNTRIRLLVLIILSVPFGKYQIDASVINISVNNAVMLFATFIFVVEAGYRRDLFSGYKAHYYAAAAFIGFSLISTTTAASIITHLRYIVAIMGSTCLLALITAWVRSRHDYDTIIKAVIATTAIVIAGAALQGIFGFSSIFPEQIGRSRLAQFGWDTGRTVGFMSSHGAYSGITILGAMMVLTIAHEKARKLLPSAPLFTALAAFVGIFAISLSQSRSGMLATGITGLSYAVLAYVARPSSMPRAMLLLVGIVTCMMFAIFFNDIYLVIDSMSPRTAQNRIDYSVAAWNIYLEHPISGVGYSAFNDITGFDNILHNTYLVVALGSGTGGILSFLSIAFIAMWRGRAAWNISRFHRNMAIVMVPAMFGVMSTLALYSGVNSPSFWIAVALLVVLPSIPVEDAPETFRSLPTKQT